MATGSAYTGWWWGTSYWGRAFAVLIIGLEVLGFGGRGGLKVEGDSLRKD
jgi:hypothetical protein